MSKFIPTKADRDAARKVLTYYARRARKLAGVCEQETPESWYASLDECAHLLKRDPEKVFAEYLAEYKAGQ